MTKQAKTDKNSPIADPALVKIQTESPVAEGAPRQASPKLQKEINGPKGLEPTRYGDWESKGRCHDF